MVVEDDGDGTLEALAAFGPVLAIKLYRLTLDSAPAVPRLPCLDHEAKLHARVAPHFAAYVQDRTSGDIHEVAFFRGKARIEVDTVSTWGECSPESHQRLLAMLRERFPAHRIAVTKPTWWRGDRRVAEACAAQVTLRDVLLAGDVGALKGKIDRLQAVGTLMEKESRVASWGVRTMSPPLLAAAGVVAVYTVSGFNQSLLVGLLGAVFLYYGLKAVQLTGMANRVWKRSAEYALILAERRRLDEEGRARVKMQDS